MTVQLTITLPVEVVESVRRAVAEGRAASESDYIADSIAVRERLENLHDVLAEWDPAATRS